MNYNIDKNIKNEPGIYEILNIKNNKRYIGQSQKVRTRLLKHRRILIKNEHGNIHLQNSVNKYGIECFEFNLIEYCPIDELDSKEDYYISYFNSNNREYGYNHRIDNKTNRGLKWSDEVREKISKYYNDENSYHKNHTIPIEILKKAWEASRNRIWTEEDRKRHSEILKGTKVKDTSNMKLAQRGENNPSDKLSEEEVKEIILLLKNKYCNHKLLSEVYGVSRSNISAISCGRSWKHISQDNINESYFIKGIEKIEKYKKQFNKYVS